MTHYLHLSYPLWYPACRPLILTHTSRLKFQTRARPQPRCTLQAWPYVAWSFLHIPTRHRSFTNHFLHSIFKSHRLASQHRISQCTYLLHPITNTPSHRLCKLHWKYRYRRTCECKKMSRLQWTTNHLQELYTVRKPECFPHSLTHTTWLGARTRTLSFQRFGGTILSNSLAGETCSTTVAYKRRSLLNKVTRFNSWHYISTQTRGCLARILKTKISFPHRWKLHLDP